MFMQRGPAVLLAMLLVLPVAGYLWARPAARLSVATSVLEPVIGNVDVDVVIIVPDQPDAPAAGYDPRWDNGNLVFTLRSLQRYAPWIRRIFIILDLNAGSVAVPEPWRTEVIDRCDLLDGRCQPDADVYRFTRRIPGLRERYAIVPEGVVLTRPSRVTDAFAANCMDIRTPDDVSYRAPCGRIVPRINLSKPSALAARLSHLFPDTNTTAIGTYLAPPVRDDDLVRLTVAVWGDFMERADVRVGRYRCDLKLNPQRADVYFLPTSTDKLSAFAESECRPEYCKRSCEFSHVHWYSNPNPAYMHCSLKRREYDDAYRHRPACRDRIQKRPLVFVGVSNCVPHRMNVIRKFFDESKWDYVAFCGACVKAGTPGFPPEERRNYTCAKRAAIGSSAFFEFESSFQFRLAIENKNYHNYFSEKLLNPLYADQVPIVYGLKHYRDVVRTPSALDLATLSYDAFWDRVLNYKCGESSSNRQDFPFMAAALDRYERVCLQAGNMFTGRAPPLNRTRCLEFCDTAHTPYI